MKFILYLETTTWCINPLNIKIQNHETDLFTIGKTLSMTGGAVVNFLQARKPPLTPQEELTLAHIEALASIIEEGGNIGGDAKWWVWYIDNDGSHRCDPNGSAECTF